MKQVLWIDGPLPGLNEVIAEAKQHWAQYYKTKATWTSTVGWTCKAQGIRPVTKPIFLKFRWVERNNKRDLDNVAFAKKFILDGLVAAGVIPGDGWKQIAGWSDEFKVDKAKPGVRVIILDDGKTSDFKKEKYETAAI